jgi:hypothetical protein
MSDELRKMGEVRNFKCFEVHESIVRVSANQTANSGKIVEIFFRMGRAPFSRGLLTQPIY